MKRFFILLSILGQIVILLLYLEYLHYFGYLGFELNFDVLAWHFG
jgi:hypothetical protein